MIEVIKKINETNLSPNEYFLLYSLHHSVELKNIDLEVEKKGLKDKGYLDDNGELVNEVLVSKEMEEKTLIANVRTYRRIFPPIILPTGMPARGKESQILIKMKVFLQSYNYDWSIIYSATKHYVDRYEAERYKYMQSASTFLIDKNGDSSLALECEILEHKENITPNSDLL